ncbi:TetR/AcrR family transcriptional regulator [Petrocella sp. FN5]|uniref:TetR/AcrR family transcriptional regulator n=1 Tax=Petrocella sp. FN5 TaxID=3032002 RepID=UPI0023DB7D73|nr:TetR/AcrR family transcriptional regulator [Petrocella sp. FN5]MDF1618637.1 TetR/AcrR family transcriptional regulator [Petrocella sp. FN5]
MKLDKKELIRQSAAEVFSKEGYYATTVKMIAAEANIAVGTIYIYFKTKEEILDYIFAVEHNKRIHYFEGLQEHSLGVIEVIESFLDFHFNELHENPSISKVLVQEDLSPLMSKAKSMRTYSSKLPDMLAQMLKKAQESGQIGNIDAPILARLIFQLIKGSVYISQEKKEANWQNEVKKQIISLITKGIQK